MNPASSIWLNYNDLPAWSISCWSELDITLSHQDKVLLAKVTTFSWSAFSTTMQTSADWAGCGVGGRHSRPVGRIATLEAYWFIELLNSHWLCNYMYMNMSFKIHCITLMIQIIPHGGSPMNEYVTRTFRQTNLRAFWSADLNMPQNGGNTLHGFCHV